jgi:hypothetical protein
MEIPGWVNIHDASSWVRFACETGIFLTIAELTAKHDRKNPVTQAQIVNYLKENIKFAFFKKAPKTISSISFGAEVCPGISGKKTLWCTN